MNSPEEGLIFFHPSESLHFTFVALLRPSLRSFMRIGIVYVYHRLPGVPGSSVLDLLFIHYNTKYIYPLKYKVNICSIQYWLNSFHLKISIPVNIVYSTCE